MFCHEADQDGREFQLFKPAPFCKTWEAWTTMEHYYPPHNYLHLLGCVEDVHFTEEMINLDGILVFAESSSQVEQAVKEYRHAIKSNGMVWVSWYKKASKIGSDVNEGVIRDTALTLGLVDVKVCSVDEQWSALKIVWRKENRKGT